jgi:hypothetical protein
MPFIV